ncbi:MAG: squalene/phytoene synthase family protein [Archangium sp.]|nr:squalene/phytoene synthase family protein [Archangium sp.]
MFDLDDLLQKTSRTFALAIPLLPEPARNEVGVAYLLFRIADTFEDATKWPRSQRMDVLERYVEVIESKRGAEKISELCAKSPPIDHDGYLELLTKLPELFAELEKLSPTAREIVTRHAIRTTEGMSRVVARADEAGNLRLETKQDLKDYCYVVAGIVGELLTELFVAGTPSLSSQQQALNARMVAFGEGLQLVNILKDAASDATEGRVYLPSKLTLADVFAMAREDLQLGDEYVRALQTGGAPRGYLAFCGIALVLAWRALAVLEEQGAGKKVGRPDVMALFEKLQHALDAGTPLDCRALAS